MQKPKILLDSDVIRHFLKGGILGLPKIYPGRLVILDIVKSELFRSRHLQIHVNNFISMCKIEVAPFPTRKLEIMQEYAALKRHFGDGESAEI